MAVRGYAMTAASIGSVLAGPRQDLAKVTDARGLTTASGRPAAPSTAAITVSNPPAPSSTTRCGASAVNPDIRFRSRDHWRGRPTERITPS